MKYLTEDKLQVIHTGLRKMGHRIDWKSPDEPVFNLNGELILVGTCQNCHQLLECFYSGMSSVCNVYVDKVRTIYISKKGDVRISGMNGMKYYPVSYGSIQCPKLVVML
jgi:hypothetical protein